MADLLQHALQHIAVMGAAGKLAFVLLYAACCVAFFPVTPLMLGAGAVFGLWRGFVLVWLGSALGSCAAFLVARHWLRGWVEKRLSGHPKFAAIDAAVSAQGRRVVFLTRLTPLFPFSTLNYAYGVTRVRFRDYAAASGLGMMPGMFLVVYLGAAAGEASRAGQGARARTSLEWAFFAVGLIATVAVVALVGREAKRALDRGTKP